MYVYQGGIYVFYLICILLNMQAHHGAAVANGTFTVSKIMFVLCILFNTAVKYAWHVHFWDETLMCKKYAWNMHNYHNEYMHETCIRVCNGRWNRKSHTVRVLKIFGNYKDGTGNIRRHWLLLINMLWKCYLIYIYVYITLLYMYSMFYTHVCCFTYVCGTFDG